MRYAILHGDVLDHLRTLPSNSADGLLCDPPYGLRFMGKKWDYSIPGVDVWAEALRVLKPGAPLLAFGGSRTYHRMTVAIEDAGFEVRDCLMWIYGSGFPKSQDVRRAIDAANGDGAAWSGYGTALKPAFEPVILARKPLEGTMAENVARWGVGGLAIDAARIEYVPDADKAAGMRGGRWPANVIFDESAGAMLDVQSGNRPGMSGGGKHRADYPGGMFGGIDSTATARGDNGGASRFFYCPKVSKAERGEGNAHPTLKPIALITYLARLILPPKPGVLLVPFAGSGSEICGALLAGWPAVVGIERESEYVEIASARVPANVNGAKRIA